MRNPDKVEIDRDWYWFRRGIIVGAIVSAVAMGGVMLGFWPT